MPGDLSAMWVLGSQFPSAAGRTSCRAPLAPALPPAGASGWSGRRAGGMGAFPPHPVPACRSAVGWPLGTPVCKRPAFAFSWASGPCPCPAWRDGRGAWLAGNSFISAHVSELQLAAPSVTDTCRSQPHHSERRGPKRKHFKNICICCPRHPGPLSRSSLASCRCIWFRQPARKAASLRTWGWRGARLPGTTASV